MRRIGVHHIIIGNDVLNRAVVEIEDAAVVDYYEFTEELPMTEWLGGTVELRKNELGVLQAFQNNKQLC
ncbi:MAG: hypothetical protein IJV27_13085 [Prevotella sp.]|nr:hypothetical protein [Prevotella sp.]